MNDKFPPQRQGLESLPSLEVSMNQVAVRYTSEDYSRPQVLPKSYPELQTDPSPSPSPRPSSAASPVASNTRARSFFPPTPSSTGSGCQQQRHEQPQKISRSHTKSSASFEYEQMEAGAYRGGEHATRGYLGSPDAMCRGWDELVRYCQYLDAMNMRLEGIDITDVSDSGSPAPARFPPDTFNLHHSGPMKSSAPRSSSDFDRHPDHPVTEYSGSNDNLFLRRQTSSGILLRQAGSETASYGRSTSGGSGSLEHISRSESSPTVSEVARKYPAFIQAALGGKKVAATAAVVHPDGAAGNHGTSAASTSAAPPKAAGKSSNWHNSQVERLKQLEGSSCAFR